MIIVTGAVEVSDQNLDELKKISLEHVARSRLEDGCLLHSVQLDLENPNRLVFVEEWQNIIALQVHFKVPASIKFAERLTELAIAAPSLKIFESTQVN